LTTAIQGATNCINATISASPGLLGANLTQVNYSLDGGATYTPIPLAQLPFSLTVLGSGPINLVATAYDASGQSAAQSTQLNIPTTCTQAKAISAINWSSPTSITYGTQLTTSQLNATSSVPGSFVYFPAASGEKSLLEPRPRLFDNKR